MSWDAMEVLAGRRVSRLQGTEPELNHEHLLKRWESVWGREAVFARTYAKAFLEGSDVVRDFATHSLSLSGEINWLCEQEKRNERLGTGSIWLIRHANRILPWLLPKRAVTPCRTAIVRACKSSWLRRKAMQADPEWVNKLAIHYERSNQWVDSNYQTHLSESFGST